MYVITRHDGSVIGAVDTPKRAFERIKELRRMTWDDEHVAGKYLVTLITDDGYMYEYQVDTHGIYRSELDIEYMNDSGLDELDCYEDVYIYEDL